MFINKSGVKCRNIQEQVEWNLEQIEKIKEELENVGQLYIEIDDSGSIGSGTLGEDDLNKLKENAYVAVLMQRAEDVYIQFNAGSYIEQNTMIKSMSAGGYFRKLDIDLDTGDWTLTESNEDISALSDQVAQLQETVENIPEVSVSEERSESAPTGKSITIGENTYNFPEAGSLPTITIEKLAGVFSGTITQEQWDTIYTNHAKVILNWYESASLHTDTLEFYKADRDTAQGEQPLIFFTIKNKTRYTLTFSNHLTWTLEFEEVPAVSGSADDEGFLNYLNIGDAGYSIPENIVLNPEVPSGTEIVELEYIKKGNKYYQIPSGGSGEPSSYIKSISQSGNSFTWTDQDEHTDTFTVDFSGYQTTIDEDNKLNFNYISNTPTTISGYGITDAYTKTEIDDLLADKQDTIDEDHKLSYDFIDGKPTDLPVSVLTEAPTSAYTGGGVKIVHLASSTGITEYNGYIYMYDED